MVGRPRKYGEEKTRYLGVTIPEGLFNVIELFADKHHVSRSEAVALLIASSNQKYAEFLLEELRQLRSELKEIKAKAKEVKEAAEKLEKAYKDARGSLLFLRYETPPEVKEFLNQRKERIFKALDGKTEAQMQVAAEALAEVFLKEFMQEMAKKGVVPRSERMLKRIFVAEIFRVIS